MLESRFLSAEVRRQKAKVRKVEDWMIVSMNVKVLIFEFKGRKGGRRKCRSAEGRSWTIHSIETFVIIKVVVGLLEDGMHG